MGTFEDNQVCSTYQVSCKSGGCIPKTWVCDGEQDCPDESDEIGCAARTTCAPGGFKCDDGNCIPLNWQCDGQKDCTDGLDEWPQLCGKSILLPASYFHPRPFDNHQSVA